MTPAPDEFSQGEIGRSLARLEEAMTELRIEVRGYTEPVTALKVQMSVAEGNISRIDADVRNVTQYANRIAGAGAVVAFLSTLIPWPWKH